MDYLKKIIIEIELHSVEGIKECFKNNISPNISFKDKPLIYELISGYKRGSTFNECIKIFVEYDLVFTDKMLLSVLMDDAVSLDKQLKENPEAIHNRYTFDCAFTPIYEASLLHVCAEYNHLECVKTLISHGVDVNIRAGIDKNGFGGQTPVFHTVNQHNNACLDTMKYLISQSADLKLTIKGLIWGKGFDWETFVPAVNPISYSMMGLLRQFQRTEKQIYEIVEILLEEAYGIHFKPSNIPNKYLNNRS